MSESALNAVGQTSRWVAAARARESKREDRLFFDPYAHYFAGPEGFDMLDRAVAALSPMAAEGMLISLAIRTRFLDDLVSVGLAQGLDQLVILAAGMDARAFRMEFPKGFKTWELDQPEIFAIKQQIIEPLRPKTGCTRHAVPVDLREDWTQALVAANFDVSKPAILLVEGLLVYLGESQVETLLSRISQVAAPGSLLGVDIVGKFLLDSQMMAQAHEFVEQLGTSWRYGTDEPEALLKQFGWEGECIAIGEPGANFGRWPFPSPPRSMRDVPRSYFCRATKG